MWVHKSDLSKRIDDNDQFISPDGTQYPRNFPKEAIKGMFWVTQTPRPNDAENVVTGSRIELLGGAAVEVWESTPKDQAEIDGIVATTLAQRKAEMISWIKEDASRVILGRFPTFTQSNMNGEMNRINFVRGTRALTDDENDFVAMFIASFEWACAVRAMSNIIEAEVLAASSLEALQSVLTVGRLDAVL